MRLVFGILLWVGLFGSVREWLHARRHGLPVTLAEKLLLALTLPFGFVAQLAVELGGFKPDSGAIVALVICTVLNGWAMKRRIQRRTALSIPSDRSFDASAKP